MHANSFPHGFGFVGLRTIVNVRDPNVCRKQNYVFFKGFMGSAAAV